MADATSDIPLPSPRRGWGNPSSHSTISPQSSGGTSSSLANIMSEELANQLSGRTANMEPRVTPSLEDHQRREAISVADDTMNDTAIAQMLQYELNLEHDEILRRKERTFNGSSKVAVSLSKYRYLHPIELAGEVDETADFPEPSVSDEKLPRISGRGYIRSGKDIITKHDADLSSKKHLAKVMEFPPGFDTGDHTEYDSKLSNRVFNQLKIHSMASESRRKRVKDVKDEEATSTLAVDRRTRILLYKLVNTGALQSIDGLISTGKEAAVFHASGGCFEGSEKQLPEECAVKVFKTTLNEFRNRDPYIRDDYRFQERFSKLNPRKIVRFWAEKEILNLRRLFDAGIPCPEPLILRKHILVMSFIGKDQIPGAQLKEANLSSSCLRRAYEETCTIMRRMFDECKLIHADFSEYNLLWHENKVWVIDVSQAVEPAHPRALEFLYRDCSNVYNFFTRRGLTEIMTIKELFKHVTGIQLESDGTELSAELMKHQSKKEKAHKYSSELDTESFGYLFEMALRERRAVAAAEDAEEWVDDFESDGSDEEP